LGIFVVLFAQIAFPGLEICPVQAGHAVGNDLVAKLAFQGVIAGQHSIRAGVAGNCRIIDTAGCAIKNLGVAGRTYSVILVEIVSTIAGYAVDPLAIALYAVGDSAGHCCLHLPGVG